MADDIENYKKAIESLKEEAKEAEGRHVEAQ